MNPADKAGQFVPFVGEEVVALGVGHAEVMRRKIQNDVDRCGAVRGSPGTRFPLLEVVGWWGM